MALTKITTSVIAANTIATANIADNSIDSTKIASDSILTRHIDDDQVTAAKLANSINTDIATGPAALPKAGGAMTGNITSASDFSLDVEADLTLTALSDIVYQTTSTNSTAGHHLFKSFNTEIMRIDGGTNRVGIGTGASPSFPLHIKSNASETDMAIQSNVGGSGSAVGGRLRLQLGAQSNSGSGNADTQAGDVLGQIMFEGQGTDYSYQGGNIKTIVTTGDGDDGRSNQGAAMTFETIAPGSVSPTEKLRITEVGTIGVTGVGSGSLAGTILINDDGGTGTINNAYYNTGMGYECFDDLTSGDANTGLGFQAFYKLTDGYDNVAIGYGAAHDMNSGHNNVCIGKNAGDGLTTGGANIQIGSGTTPDATSAYQISIGHGVVGLGGNSVTLGKDSGNDRVYNVFVSNASWTRVSDERYKENITPNTDCGLAFINDLNPVTFTWKAKADIDENLPDYDETALKPEYDKKLYGLIAQEVKDTLDKHNIEDFGGWHVEEKTGIQAVSQEMFIHPIIKAVQELSTKLEEAEARIKTLEDS